MNSINVLYDSQIFSGQQYGGVSRIFFELIKHLVDKDDVEILLFQGYHINRFPLEDLKEKMACYRGRRAIYFPHVSVILKGLNHYLFKRFSRGKAVDIYHPTNYSSLVYRWKKSPVVLHVNDMIPELFPRNFKDIKSRLKVKKRCIERADIIITISYNTKKDLLSYYNLPEDNIKVIYPGAPSPPSPAESRGIRPFPHSRPFILYVGTRKQVYKNFYNFYFAYAASQKLVEKFDIVCFGGPYFKRKELQYLAGAAGSVRIFQPSGDESLLPMLYRGAAALVYPSLYEGFGLPPLEAMAYGCPVITGKTSALPEVLGDAAAYFNPYEVDSMTAVMESILFNKELRQKLVKKGKKQVKKYSWAAMAEETYRIYKELAQV